MKKGKKRSLIFATLLFAVILTANGVSGTYARYITEYEGTGKAEVAAWAVKITDGTDELTEDFELVLDEENNTDVVVGKIAPGASVYKDVVVELEGTEVTTEILATLGENIEGVEGDDSRFHLNVSEVEGSTVTPLTATSGVYTIKKELGAGRTAFTSDDTVTLRVELVWDNVEASNEDDTTMGEAAGNIIADLTLTARQYIAS